MMRRFYFAPHPNYYAFLVMGSALILSSLAPKIMPNYKKISILCVFALFLNLGYQFNHLDATIEKHNSFKHFQMVDFVHKNSYDKDIIMNGYDMNFNIYRPDASYYWFGLDMLLPVMQQEFKLGYDIDVNDLVLKYQPRFIYVKNYPDLRAFRTYGEIKNFQVFSADILKNNYILTPFEYLVVKK